MKNGSLGTRHTSHFKCSTDGTVAAAVAEPRFPLLELLSLLEAEHRKLLLLALRVGTGAGAAAAIGGTSHLANDSVMRRAEAETRHLALLLRPLLREWVWGQVASREGARAGAAPHCSGSMLLKGS